MSNTSDVHDAQPHPDLQSISTVTAIVPGERPIVRLSQTPFFPEGQCRTADRGLIGPAQVVHVVQNGDEIDHYVDTADALVVGQQYAVSIDGQWRYEQAVAHYLAAKIFHDILHRRPEDCQ